jgi:protein-S-isoprenylcysteine O-methyltransferase Ste14
MVNFLLLGILDFDSFILPHLKQRLPFALCIFAIGSGIGSWAFLTFGLKNTIGIDSKLITHGPYRFSRNPQYMGDSMNILGYLVLSNSIMVLIIGILGISLNLLAPLLEEPWLEEQYEEDYLEYKRKVPRFIGKVAA